MARLIAALLLLLGGLGASLLATVPAAAQQVGRITCSSQNYRPAFCPVANLADARIVTTLGGNCIEGRSWRQNRGGIQVDNGCRAVFEVRTGFGPGPGGGYPGPGGGYPGPGGGNTSIVCESLNYRPARCPMNTLGGVQLVRIIGGSPCRQGSTWGFERGAVWVNGGCRAQFTSAGPGGGYPGGGYPGGGYPGGGNPGPGNPGGYTIECSSRDYRPARCPANINQGVQLIAVLGGECIQGRSWRWNRNAIQVSDGCRARFRVY